MPFSFLRQFSVLFAFLLQHIHSQIAFTRTSGDTFYVAIPNSTTAALTTKNNYVGSPNYTNMANIGTSFGTIYDQLGFNNTVVGCTTANQLDTDMDYICLLAPNSSTPGQYQLRLYRPEYFTPEAPIKNVWYNQSVLNLSLAHGKNYFLFPSDSEVSKVYIVATEHDPKANATMAYYTTVLVNKASKLITITPSDKPQTAFQMNATNFTLLPYAKSSSGFGTTLVLFNTLNSSKPLNVKDQPPNNQLLVITFSQSGTQAANVIKVFFQETGKSDKRFPEFIMDVEILANDLYLIGLDKTAAASPISMQAFVIGLPTFEPGLQLTELSTWSNPVILHQAYLETQFMFYHFAFLKNNKDANVLMLVRHEDTIFNQVLKAKPIGVEFVGPTGQESNTNQTYFVRPLENNIEVRVQKFGMLLNQLNILYLVNGNLVYLDLFSAYGANSNEATPDDGGPTPELLRIGASFCDKAFSLYSLKVAPKSGSINSGGFNLQCLRDNILISRWGESNNTFYSAVIEVPPATAPAKQALTFNTYNPFNEGTFSAARQYEANLSFGSSSFYSKIMVYTPPNPTEIIVGVNIPEVIPIKIDAFMGSNLTFSITPPIQNITLFDQRFSVLNVIRGTSTEVVADNYFHVTDGCIFEENNRAFGFVNCTERPNYENQTFDRTCTSVAKQALGSSPTSQEKVSVVQDEFVACKAILIMVEGRTANVRTVFYFDTTLQTLTKVGTLTGKDQYTMGCSNSFVFAAGWKTEVFSASVAELVFSKATKQLVVPVDAAAGFGLLGLTGIIEGHIRGTEFLLTQWMEATKILTIKRFKFSSRPAPAFKEAGQTDNMYFGDLRAPFRVGFTSKVYIPYSPQNMLNNLILRAYYGDTYGGNKKFWGKLLYNLTTAGFTEVLGLFFHEVDAISAFTVYGRQQLAASRPELIMNYTLIATFTVHDEYFFRLFKVYNTTRVFSKVTCSDNSKDQIFIYAKDITGHTNTFRVYLGSNFLTVNIGIIALDSFNLKFTISNNASSTFFSVPVKFQNVSAINVTAKNDLEYKSGTVLTLLPGLASLVKGHITKIDLAGPENVVIAKNRVSPSATPAVSFGSAPANRSTVRRPMTIMGRGDRDVEAIYVDDDHQFYVLQGKSNPLACATRSEEGVLDFTVRESRAELKMIHIVFQSALGTLSLLQVNTSTTPAVCQSVTQLLPNTAEPTPLTSSSSFVVFSNPSRRGASYDFVLIVINPGTAGVKYFNVTNSTKNQLIIKSESYDTMGDAPQNKFIPASGFLTCVPLQTDLDATSTLRLVLCIHKLTEGSGITVINFVYGTPPTARASTVSLTSNQDLQSVAWGEVVLSCSLLVNQSIKCIYNLTSGMMAEFFLNRDKSAARSGCDHSSYYCFSIESRNYTYPLAGLVSTFGIEASSDYFLSTVKKKGSSKLDPNTYILVYKRGQNESYYSRTIETNLATNGYTYKFYGNSTSLTYEFDPSAMKVSYFDIGEVQLLFTAPNSTLLSSSLLLSNWDPPKYHFSLPLKPLFKPPKVVVPPVPPTATTSFLKKYWWAFAAGAVLLLAAGWMLYRREQLKKKAALAQDEIRIDSLTEFYYKR